MEKDQHLLQLDKNDLPNFQSMSLIGQTIPTSDTCSILSDGMPDFSRIAASTLQRIACGGAALLRREVMLPRLLGVGPDELSDRSITGRRAIVRRLARALRGERMRGRAGHWTYSLDRHVGLLQAYRAERDALRVAERDAKKDKGVRGTKANQRMSRSGLVI